MMAALGLRACVVVAALGVVAPQRHARDALREMHHKKRQHPGGSAGEGGGASAASPRPGGGPTGAPGGPTKSRPSGAFLRARAQHVADAFVDRNQTGVPRDAAEMLARWGAQLEAHVAANLVADVFEGPPGFGDARPPFDCDGVQVLGAFHKTGTFFASALVSALGDLHGVASRDFENDGGSLRYDNFSRLARPLAVPPGGRFLVEVLLPDFGIGELLGACRGARVAILARDPVEMVLSGYNYHRRLPAPEPWLDWRGGLFANPCSDYVHARSSLKRPNAGLVVSCAVGLRAFLADDAAATYGGLLRAAPLDVGLRAEALRALVGAGDAVRQSLWMERVVAGDLLVTGSAAFATMAGFERPGQFGAVARGA